MNKRLRAKRMAEKKRRRELHRILDLILDINGTGERRRKETGDLPTAFLDFSGHVGRVDVQIYDTGWDREEKMSHKLKADTYMPSDLKKTVKELEKIRCSLKPGEGETRTAKGYPVR